MARTLTLRDGDGDTERAFAVNGGHPWLEIRCARCKTPSEVNLAAVKHPPATFVHDLASRLRRRKCAKAGRRPATTPIQLAWQPRHPRTEEPSTPLARAELPYDWSAPSL